MKKLGRNEPCQCGSGRKYKHCCWQKKFEWVVDEHGDVHRRVPIDDPRLMEGLREACEGKQPDEPVFGDLGHMEYIEAEMVDIMKEIGMDPAFIYAYEKTGLLVTEDNKDKMTDLDLEEWREAVERYRRLAEEGDAPDI
jgi:uncharacterized protein YecA (UPF0149 family)